jgi:hypothetical protein
MLAVYIQSVCGSQCVVVVVVAAAAAAAATLVCVPMALD